MSPQSFAILLWASIPCSRVTVKRTARKTLDNLKASFSNLWATEWLGIVVPFA
jgi:hypothetical protein